MKNTTKILLGILILGILYSFFKLFTGQGGSGLYDFFDALAYSSIVLFLTSLTVLLINVKRLRKNLDTLVFVLISLPLTISVVDGIVGNMNYNRVPELIAKYPRPISLEQFRLDSVNIKTAIDSMVALKNRNSRNSQILYALIDTIIYSQKGDKIFIIYLNKYSPNNYGNDFVSAAFFADKKDSLFWNLEEAKFQYSGDFHNVATLKREVRKFYFNQFRFADKDSLKDNFFWRKLANGTATIIVN
jgi:hypothetical protein